MSNSDWKGNGKRYGKRKHPKLGEEWTTKSVNNKTNKIKKEMEDLKSMEEELIKMFKEKIKGIGKDQDVTEYLDSIVDEVENMIFLTLSLKGIWQVTKVPQYKFFRWTKETQYAERIALAYQFSAEQRMEKSQEILEKYILDPNLTIQQTSLIRELALHHSRMAGFRDQHKFGKNAGEAKAKTSIQIVTDDQMKQLISELVKDADNNKKELEQPITPSLEISSQPLKQERKDDNDDDEESQINQIINEE